MAGASFPLEGDIQTVPRAELFTILILLRNLQPNASAIIVSDSLVNIELFYKGKTHALGSTNGDLWVGVFHEILSKELHISIKWVQGHLDTKNGKQWFPPLWRALNIGADHYADLAAKKFELPTHVTEQVQTNCELADAVSTNPQGKHLSPRHVCPGQSMCPLMMKPQNLRTSLFGTTRPKVGDAHVALRLAPKLLIPYGHG